MTMHFRRVVLPLALLATGACGSGGAGAAKPASAPTASRLEPNADELKRDLFVFAADSFRGRETGTPDADRAAAWIAQRLTKLGLEPAGDSGFFQRVPMTRSRTIVKEITVTTPNGKVTPKLGADIAFLTALGPGAFPRLSADGDVVFASYGLADPTLGRNDYDGIEAQGKVIVIAGVVPPGIDSTKRKQLENPQVLFSRIGLAIGKQPAAIVLLLPDSVFRLAASQFGENQLELAKETKGPENRAFPLIAVARLTSGSPFVPASWPASDKSTDLAGTHFTASIDVQKSEFNGYNVVGIVRGSDPALNKTYVAYGAHYDHIGVQKTAVNGDSIANGADDDGSGSVTLLSIARGWVEGPRPKRSGLFVWHVGEEKGLFGSEVFTDKPTVPIDSIVAQLNADMIGRNGDDSLYIVGPMAAPKGQSAVLGAVVDSVNAGLPHKFIFDREWDTPTHPERIYYRSDHYNYARKGIPIVFFTTGLHKQYHQVSDEPALINYDKMARVGSLMFRTGILLGNRASRPLPSAVQ